MDYSLIIKITNACNLNCSYCYHRKDANRDFGSYMSREMLEKMIKKILEHNQEFAEFIWHGGEPLMAGLDTFKFIVEKQKEYNKKSLKITNSIQTNGTLLNDDFIKFFKEHDFHVGISIDGPYDMHSSKRGTEQSEYENILSSLRELSDNGGRYGILCVVGKQHISHEKELFGLFNEYKIKNIGFLPCLVQENGIVDYSQTITPQEYGEFLINFFEVWIHGTAHGLSVRNFDDCIRFFNKIPAKVCVNANCCDRYLTILPDGNIYMCDNFSANSEHIVSTLEKGFDNIEETEAMLWLKKSMLQIPELCSKCKFYCGCYSGCKYLRWVNDREMKKGQFYCTATKMLYGHIGKYLSMEEA